MSTAKLITESKLLGARRESKIKYLTCFITIGFVCITFFYYYQGLVLGLSFPNNTFLPLPIGFGDFFGVVDQWAAFKFKGIGYGLSYFPSTYLIANFFSNIHPRYLSLSIFLIGFAVLFIFYVYINLRSERSLISSIHYTFVCVFMTYPVLFVINTANFEVFIFLFLCLFVYLYQKEMFVLSCIPLAAAISMKVIPAVFLILFISNKKYKEISLTLFGIFFLSILPLAIFEGGGGGLDVYWSNLMASQKMYSDLMIMGTAGNHYGHSLLNSLRILMGDNFTSVESVVTPYFFLTLFIFSLIAVFIAFVEKIFWKKIALLVICMCLLPYTSTDYKLLHFFIPLFLFINAKDDGKNNSIQFDIYYIGIFSLLLIPKNYFYFHGQPLYSVNNVLNTALMIILCSLIIVTTYKSKRSNVGMSKH